MSQDSVQSLEYHSTQMYVSASDQGFARSPTGDFGQTRQMDHIPADPDYLSNDIRFLRDDFLQPSPQARFAICRTYDFGGAR